MNKLFILLLMTTVFFASSCMGRRDVEKEIWILPCNHTGNAIVYFNSSLGHQPDSALHRIYRIDTKGVGYSKLSKNDGFSADLNQTMVIKMLCDTSTIIVPYFENSVVDTVSAKVFATNLIVGRKNGHAFKSIMIIRRDG